MELIDAHIDDDTVVAEFFNDEGETFEFAWCIYGLMEALAEKCNKNFDEFIVEHGVET